MSTIIPTALIDYPESDGKPMGETDWHIEAIFRLRDMLRFRYRGERVYVGSNLLVYYVEDEPRHFVVPDVFVVFDCDPKVRRVFKIWEEGRAPDIVFEMTSRSTAREDQIFKPKIYEQIGVKELFLFDPTSEYLVPPLQGFRFSDHSQIRLESNEGVLHSETLGVSISTFNSQLQLIDSKTAKEILTGEEFERQAKEVERTAKEAERIAKEAERQGRIAAEAQINRLNAEIEKLRNRDEGGRR